MAFSISAFVGIVFGLYPGVARCERWIPSRHYATSERKNTPRARP